MKFREIALEIAHIEAGKRQVDIAQINEILKITLHLLSNLPQPELDELLSKYKDKQSINEIIVE